MEIGLIGLGKMGYPLALNLIDKGHHVTGHDVIESARKAAVEANIGVIDTVEGLVSHLPERKVIWLMVPAGNGVEEIDGATQSRRYCD